MGTEEVTLAVLSLLAIGESKTGVYTSDFVVWEVSSSVSSS